MTERDDDSPPPQVVAPEPVFNAPAVSIALLALLAIAYGIQVFLLTPDQVEAGALSAQALAQGRWFTLISHMFLHGNLVHILMNGGAALAFGPAVARHFGPGLRAGLVFMLFYLVCGVVGGLGYVALNPGGAGLVIGASGAISGLWGGAARLIGRRRGLSGLWEGPVRGQIAVVVVFNLLIGLTGFAAGGLSIAWEAHIAGFVAGLLLIGSFTRLARASYRSER
ncbi:MAG: rhomboid family intramembrane serine protease [Caulobacterales bacterium]|nr:rhomboid family intramembrane serine protease [Caulobacterales bacterium]